MDQKKSTLTDIGSKGEEGACMREKETAGKTWERQHARNKEMGTLVLLRSTEKARWRFVMELPDAERDTGCRSWLTTTQSGAVGSDRFQGHQSGGVSWDSDVGV
ncbi:hypothetical protein RJT34_17541 [Clitoria ternatea]|uniref:Uncharacterized protein n=1 Tax=Clitoria ternatea TaxID=43366 RepID=A0AAN9PDV7_CLITE